MFVVILRIKLKARIVPQYAYALHTCHVRTFQRSGKHAVVVGPKDMAFLNCEIYASSRPVLNRILFTSERSLLAHGTTPREKVSKAGCAKFSVNHLSPSFFTPVRQFDGPDMYILASAYSSS